MLWRSPAPARRPPGFIEPCLPTLARTVPSGPQWVHEIKHDGYRFICRRDGDRVRVFSRRGNDYTDRVPLIAEALAKLRVKSVTLDGEGVGTDGVSDFEFSSAEISCASTWGTDFGNDPSYFLDLFPSGRRPTPSSCRQILIKGDLASGDAVKFTDFMRRNHPFVEDVSCCGRRAGRSKRPYKLVEWFEN